MRVRLLRCFHGNDILMRVRETSNCLGIWQPEQYKLAAFLCCPDMTSLQHLFCEPEASQTYVVSFTFSITKIVFLFPHLLNSTIFYFLFLVLHKNKLNVINLAFFFKLILPIAFCSDFGCWVQYLVVLSAPQLYVQSLKNTAGTLT